MNHNLYDELGVASTADEQEIRQAYRRRAQQCHPDKGGNKEEFQRVKQAYDVLSNPERRESYDATGDVLDLDQEHMLAEARDLLASMYRNFVMDALPAVAHTNIVERMAARIEITSRDLDRELANQEKRTKNLENANKRLRHKRGEDSFLYRAGMEMLQNELKTISKMKRGQAMLKEAASMCAEYSYEVAKPSRERSAGEKNARIFFSESSEF